MPAQFSGYTYTLLTDYGGTVQDISQYVMDIVPTRDVDSLDVTTFRTSGYRPTQGRIRGALKAEFTITLLWTPTVDRLLDPLIGNDTGFLLQVQMGNGSYPQQGDDLYQTTITILAAHYTYSSAGTTAVQVKIDCKPTDSATAVAPVWKKV